MEHNDELAPLAPTMPSSGKFAEAALIGLALALRGKPTTNPIAPMTDPLFAQFKAGVLMGMVAGVAYPDWAGKLVAALHTESGQLSVEECQRILASYVAVTDGQLGAR